MLAVEEQEGCELCENGRAHYLRCSVPACAWGAILVGWWPHGQPGRCAAVRPWALVEVFRWLSGGIAMAGKDIIMAISMQVCAPKKVLLMANYLVQRRCVLCKSNFWYIHAGNVVSRNQMCIFSTRCLNFI